MGYKDPVKQKRYNRRYQHDNLERLTETKQKKRNERQRWLRQQKEESDGCMQCGEKHPACLDYHHRRPAAKTVPISFAIGRNWCWKRLQDELDKCDLLCANCHRKLHDDDHRSV